MKEKGLSNEEVKKSRYTYGTNEIKNKSKRTLLKIIIDSLSDPIIKILLIAFAVKVVFLFENTNIFETIGILIAVLLASLISSMSEYSSEKSFEKLMLENSKINCKVIRNGKNMTVKVEEIVVGDSVVLEVGDKIPADGILVKGELIVDESNLTGETIEKEKNVYNDNKLYRSSIVIAKKCIMKVTSVGENTYYGKIAESINTTNTDSPLKLRLTSLAKTISIIGYIGAFLVIFSYLFNVLIIKNGFNLSKIIFSITNLDFLIPHIIYALTLGVTIIVVSVPEGLPMMITLVLSSNMKRMIKDNVLVRKLTGIEAMGSINMLFTDKTGTLTEGNLTVDKFLIDSKFINDVSVIKNQELSDIIYQSLILNNDAFFDENNNIIGSNSTDKAILNYFKNIKYDKYHKINYIAFDSMKKYSMISTNYNNKTYFFKGAYEKIIKASNKYINSNGEEKLLDSYKINEIENIILKNNDYRIIAFAYGKSDKLYDLVLVGFIFLKDKVRKNVKKSVKEVKEAGIKVVMVTGDSLSSAKNIALETGILESESDIILSSSEFEKLTDEEVKKILPNLKVLARSLPQDKYRLVCLSQELENIVGMTGDGVNDAPALKKAEVGISMGSGTDVAKEVSDLIILDNNFLSISKSILYGRTIFKSIRKFIIFQLTINMVALSLSIIGPFIGVITPVTIIQMLWINMVMDTLAGLAFAYEMPSKEFMKENPKNKNDHIINKYMISEILFSGFYASGLCIYFLKSNFIKELFRVDCNSKYLMTAFFGLFIFLAIFNAFNARTTRINLFSNLIKNKGFIIVISFISIVQIILIYFGGKIFRTTGLTLFEFEIMLLFAFTIIPVDIIRKIILKKLGFSSSI